MKKILIIYFFLVLVSCITTNKDHQRIKAIASHLEAEIILEKDTIIINLINNTSDPVIVPSTVGTRGFDLIVTHQRSGEVFYDTRGKNISVMNIKLDPGEVYNLTGSVTRNGWSVTEFLFFNVNIKKSGYYDVFFEAKKYDIKENVTIYFDYEKVYNEL